VENAQTAFSAAPTSLCLTKRTSSLVNNRRDPTALPDGPFTAAAILSPSSQHLGRTANSWTCPYPRTSWIIMDPAEFTQLSAVPDLHLARKISHTLTETHRAVT
jgi:hypothetical protein